MQILDTALARRVRRSRALRPPAIAAYRAAVRVMPAPPGPSVVANSMPKSGTHMLATLLDQIPGMRFSGQIVLFQHEHFHDPQPQLRVLDRRLKRLRRSHYIGSHLVCVPEVESRVAASDVKLVTIVRDPRAVVVSAAHYVMNAPQLRGREAALELFPDKKALLNAAVFGHGEPGDEFYAPDIGTRFAAYAGWAESPVGLTVRFEDLVGARGGGDRDLQVQEVRRILDHLEVDGVAADAVAAGLFSEKAITFRAGTVDSWRADLTPELINEIETRCASSMDRLGYHR